MNQATPRPDRSTEPVEALANRGNTYEDFVIQTGIDTIEYAFRLDESCFSSCSSPWEVFRGDTCDEETGELVSRTFSRGQPSFFDPTTTVRFSLVKTYGRRLVKAEGPLWAFSDLPGPRALVDPGLAEVGEENARLSARRLGIDLSKLSATVSRFDPAVNFCFSSSASGKDFLAALGTLNLTGCKRTTTTEVGNCPIEGVQWANGGGITVRAYDKAVEQVARKGHADFARGEVIRVERQCRRKFPKQIRSSGLDPVLAAEEFLQPFRGWAVENISVAGQSGLQEQIWSQIGKTEISKGTVLTERSAQRLFGATLMLANGGNRAFENARRAADARRQLKKLGISPGRLADFDSEIPVGKILLTGQTAIGGATS